MEPRSNRLIAVALAGACFALVPYVASAQDAATAPLVAPVTAPPVVEDVAVAETTAGGGGIGIPPIYVHVDPATVSEPAFSSPEEEDLTSGVYVEDPGPVMPVDPGTVDVMVTSSIGGELPDNSQYTSKAGDETPTASDCSASPRTPVKSGMKIEASGAISCGSVQRSLNVVVCIEYREAGTWETLACKPKTVSQTKAADKKVSGSCLPGRFFYRTRVTGAATAKSGAKADVPERTAPTSGRIACAA